MSRKIITAICVLASMHLSASRVLAEEYCSQPVGVEHLLSDESVQFVVFGEVHGSAEAPAFFAESVCTAVASGKKVLVGLEFPESSAAVFQQFLLSAGSPDDIRMLLTNSYWIRQAIQFPDGRTSQAMLGLIQRLRVLRASDYNLSITTFQRPVQGNHESQTPYESGLAASLMEAESDGDYDLVMVLVGNLHAYKAVVDASPPFEPMAMHLPQNTTITLNMISSGGEAWNCRSECSSHPLRASTSEQEARITLGAALVVGYDGVFNVGAASASPPVTEVP